jgi:hypothetical protein
MASCVSIIGIGQIDSSESTTEDQTISFYSQNDLPSYYNLAQNFAGNNIQLADEVQQVNSVGKEYRTGWTGWLPAAGRRSSAALTHGQAPSPLLTKRFPQQNSLSSDEFSVLTGI